MKKQHHHVKKYNNYYQQQRSVLLLNTLQHEQQLSVVQLLLIVLCCLLLKKHNHHGFCQLAEPSSPPSSRGGNSESKPASDSRATPCHISTATTGPVYYSRHCSPSERPQISDPRNKSRFNERGRTGPRRILLFFSPSFERPFQLNKKFALNSKGLLPLYIVQRIYIDIQLEQRPFRFVRATLGRVFLFSSLPNSI